MTPSSNNLDQWCFAWFEASQVAGRDRGLLWVKSKWTTGQTITVSFLDGDPALHARIEPVARQWTDPGRANLFLDFRHDTNQTDIRISFAHPGSWSVLGNTCLRLPSGEPTMNFGWLKALSSAAEVERVVLHEFGHALGLVHEHQQPGAIEWDQDAVYADLEARWSREKIDQNFFATVDAGETAQTAVDPQSIMMYPIKRSWTKNGFSAGLNAHLSPIDVAFIHTTYS